MKLLLTISILFTNLFASTSWADPPPSSEMTLPPELSSPGSGPQDSGPIVSLDFDHEHELDSAFRLAARNNDLHDLERLFNQGAVVDSTSEDGTSALMYSSKNCAPSIVRALLRFHADVNLQDSRGRTALMLAARESCEPVVQLLLKTPGLKAAIRDKAQLSALDYAREAASLEVDGPSIQIVQLLHQRTGSSRK